MPAATPGDGVARPDAARTRHDGGHHAGRDQADRGVGRRTTDTGDQAEMEWTPSDNAWRAVSVGSDECPGADRCPLGDPCFAEQARRRAAAADVIVVNTHLYGLDVASGGAILPEHDVVVFDEAHVLEDVMSDTVGVEIAPGRFTALAGVVRRIVDDPQLIGSIAEIAESLRDAIGGLVGTTPDRLRCPTRCSDVLTDARLRLGSTNEVLVGIIDRCRGRQAAQAAGADPDGPGDRAARHRHRGPRGLRRVRVGLARFAAARAGAARRRTGDGRGRVVEAHRDPDERDHPLLAGVTRRDPGRRASTSRRRRQPVRLRGELDALLRDAPAEPEQRGVPRRRSTTSSRR